MMDLNYLILNLLGKSQSLLVSLKCKNIPCTLFSTMRSMLKFAYVSPSKSLKLRKMLINDEDNDEENDYIQSDKTQLCLNLGLMDLDLLSNFKMDMEDAEFAQKLNKIVMAELKQEK